MTRMIEVDPTRPDAAAVAAATQVLRAGEVVGLPTDTVYGIAADPRQRAATQRIFQLKGRPRHVVLPVLVADAAQAETLVDAIGDEARRLMDRYWPGPLTLILPKRSGVELHIGTEETNTVGLRCPDAELVRALCRSGGPLATTSANWHGNEPLTAAADLARAFGNGLALVLDGGPCRGRPSTLCDCTVTPPVVRREGVITEAELRRVASGAPGAGSSRH